MESNKYLEKLASRFGKVIDFTDDLIGHSASILKQEADILARAEVKGRSASQALGEASDAHSRMVDARTKFGIGVVGAGTAGFLGLHKYHQHKDNAILAKIDSMYANQNR